MRRQGFCQSKSEAIYAQAYAAARAQRDVVGVGLPDDTKPEKVVVEPERTVEIAHSQGQVTQAEALQYGLRRGHCGESL